MFQGIIARLSFNVRNFLWRHHRHPWNGWFRVAVWPLAALAIWFQLWTLLAVVILAAVLSPFFFPKPETGEAWMTRAIDGERIFLKTASTHAKLVVLGLPLIHMAPLLWALLAHSLIWVVYFGGALLLGRLVFLAWMVDLADRSTYDRENGPYQHVDIDEVEGFVRRPEVTGF